MSAFADLMPWMGAVGAWLLFAGPIYQAALELREHDAVVERLRLTATTTLAPPSVSWWWWLLPPVRIALEWRRRHQVRDALTEGLSEEDHASLVGFIHKATGWTLVATGAWLLACVQSFDLARAHHLDTAPFLASLVVVTLTSIITCAARLKGRDPVR